MQYFIKDEPKTWALLNDYYKHVSGEVPEWVHQRRTLLDIDNLHDVACMCSQYELPIKRYVVAIETATAKPLAYRLKGQLAFQVVLDYHTEHNLPMDSRFAIGGGRTVIDNPELMRAVAEAASYYELDLGCLVKEVTPDGSPL